jgi:hypothetical protein
MTKNIEIKIANGKSVLSVDIENDFKVPSKEEFEKNNLEVGKISKRFDYIQFRRSEGSIYRRYN